jgi:hypothetical protein
MHWKGDDTLRSKMFAMWDLLEEEACKHTHRPQHLFASNTRYYSINSRFNGLYVTLARAKATLSPTHDANPWWLTRHLKVLHAVSVQLLFVDDNVWCASEAYKHRSSVYDVVLHELTVHCDA